MRRPEVRVGFEPSDDERMGSERLVPDRVERVLDDAVERHDVGRFTVRLHDGNIDEARLNLHVCVRETLESVAGDRTGRPKRRPELVGDEFRSEERRVGNEGGWWW